MLNVEEWGFKAAKTAIMSNVMILDWDNVLSKFGARRSADVSAIALAKLLSR